MTLGITGHQELDDPTWVKSEIIRILRLQAQPIIGVTCLAVGADQLFAQAVLECNGAVHVIVPCEKYAEAFDTSSRRGYEQLLLRAVSTEVLSHTPCSEETYFVAGKKVVDLSEMMIAVWNGQAAAGLGGTADIVEYARVRGKRYAHVNPVNRETTFFP
jgi:hypothetical protein